MAPPFATPSRTRVHAAPGQPLSVAFPAGSFLRVFFPVLLLLQLLSFPPLSSAHRMAAMTNFQFLKKADVAAVLTQDTASASETFAPTTRGGIPMIVEDTPTLTPSPVPVPEPSPSPPVVVVVPSPPPPTSSPPVSLSSPATSSPGRQNTYPNCPFTNAQPMKSTLDHPRCPESKTDTCCTDCFDIFSMWAKIAAFNTSNWLETNASIATQFLMDNREFRYNITPCDALDFHPQCQINLEALFCALWCNPDSGSYFVISDGNNGLATFCSSFADLLYSTCTDVAFSFGDVVLKVGDVFQKSEEWLYFLATFLAADYVQPSNNQPINIVTEVVEDSSAACYGGPIVEPTVPVCCDDFADITASGICPKDTETVLNINVQACSASASDPTAADTANSDSIHGSSTHAAPSVGSPCPPSPAECAFSFQGHEGKVPTFSVSEAGGAAISSPIVAPQATLVLAANSSQASYLCNAPFAADEQFYTSKGKVQARAFQAAFGGAKPYDGVYVKVPLSSVDVSVGGSLVNLHDGDGNVAIPESKRCVLFRVGSG